MRRLALALLLLTSCLDFEEAQKQYCATHPGFCTLDGGVLGDGG